MKNHYQELRDRQQEEVNAFPMFFAFDQRQFAEGMRRLGLRPSDMNQVYAIAGTGGFYRKSDAPKLHEMFARHRKELDEAIAADKAGDNFIYEMFLTELSNHEYGYTGDVQDTLMPGYHSPIHGGHASAESWFGLGLPKSNAE